MKNTIVLNVNYRGVPYEVTSKLEEGMPISDLEGRLLVQVGIMIGAVREETGEFDRPEDFRLYGK